ncbi:disulfide reductase, partial [Candidatus Bathyarchaeota archaeon]
MEKETPRIGIFVCECGGNIGDVIDVKAVVDAVKNWENVVIAKQNKYLCSKPAQEMILEAIKKNNLDRVIVASCTPRMHLTTFQSVLERAGLNPYMLEFVNIREQSSWVHGPHASAEATKKAISLIRGGYERSKLLEPLET